MPSRRLRVDMPGPKRHRNMQSVPSAYGFLSLLAFWNVLDSSPISAAVESRLLVLAYSLCFPSSIRFGLVWREHQPDHRRFPKFLWRQTCLAFQIPECVSRRSGAELLRLGFLSFYFRLRSWLGNNPEIVNQPIRESVCCVKRLVINFDCVLGNCVEFLLANTATVTHRRIKPKRSRLRTNGLVITSGSGGFTECGITCGPNIRSCCIIII